MPPPDGRRGLAQRVLELDAELVKEGQARTAVSLERDELQAALVRERQARTRQAAAADDGLNRLDSSSSVVGQLVAQHVRARAAATSGSGTKLADIRRRAFGHPSPSEERPVTPPWLRSAETLGSTPTPQEGPALDEADREAAARVAARIAPVSAEGDGWAMASAAMARFAMRLEGGLALWRERSRSFSDRVGSMRARRRPRPQWRLPGRWYSTRVAHTHYTSHTTQQVLRPSRHECVALASRRPQVEEALRRELAAAREAAAVASASESALREELASARRRAAAAAAAAGAAHEASSCSRGEETPSPAASLSRALRTQAELEDARGAIRVAAAREAELRQRLEARYSRDTAEIQPRYSRDTAAELRQRLEARAAHDTPPRQLRSATAPR